MGLLNLSVTKLICVAFAIWFVFYFARGDLKSKATQLEIDSRTCEETNLIATGCTAANLPTLVRFSRSSPASILAFRYLGDRWVRGFFYDAFEPEDLNV